MHAGLPAACLARSCRRLPAGPLSYLPFPFSPLTHHRLSISCLPSVHLPFRQAYLKSLRQPVGGKKGELEERVRQSLGGVAAAPAGA